MNEIANWPAKASNYLRSVLRLGGWAIFRLAITALSALGFVALLVLESLNESFADFLSAHPLLTTVIFGVLAAAFGFATLYTGRALRAERINDAATAIALGALVFPLLGVELVLSELAGDRRMLLVTYAFDHREQRKKKGQSSSPLKWTRRLGAMERDSADGSPSELAAQFSQAEEDENLDERHERRHLIGECTREVAGSIRDWAPLLVLTEIGQKSLFALQSLRVDLQNLQSLIAHENGDVDVDELIRLHHRTLFLAVNFEDASFPKGRRREVMRAIEHRQVAPTTSSDSVAGPASQVVGTFLANLDLGSGPSTRGERESAARENIEGLYLEQDDLRLSRAGDQAKDDYGTTRHR